VDIRAAKGEEVYCVKLYKLKRAHIGIKGIRAIRVKRREVKNVRG
jgi:hypothetical protein